MQNGWSGGWCVKPESPIVFLAQPLTPTGIRTICICVRGEVIHITQNHWHSTGEMCLLLRIFSSH